VSEISDLPLIRDFEFLGRICVRGGGGEKFRVHNVLTSTMIWS
jgi:hypothetical protein